MPDKKKPRTPPPPRRVQAPQRRAGTTAPSDLGARQRLLLYGFAGAGVVALAVVIALVAFGGGSSGGTKAAAGSIEAAGCQFKTYPALPRAPHYTTLNPTPAPKWNSFPPSSGRHYYQPLVFGQYDQPVLEIQAMHNLEHGGVILQYGSKVSKGQVDAITQWYRADANGLVVAPLPSLGDKVAMTAWTRWSECTGFNAKAANAFRKAFRYRAPEKFPKSFLEPGQ